MKHIFHISIVSVIVCFLIQSNLYAQQNDYKPAKVIPPSPTAASLGKYGDISVGYYTGSPDINIALYTLSTSNHSVPITMRYNYNGSKVNEIASWVGLGWSLSAGGVITRSVIGLDDFGNNGYYNGPALPPNTNPPTMANYNYFKDILLGYKDGEPDIFNYNLGKYSGKFVLGKKADGSLVFMDDRNNLKVTYQESSQSWLVVAPDGYKYYLGTRESADDYNFDSQNVEVSEDAPLSAFTRNTGYSPTTSWYLDSIVSPNTEAIKFNYAIKSNSLSLINKSESYFHLLELYGGCSSAPVETPGVRKIYNASRQVIYDTYLTSIQSKLGSIEFNTTDRNDVSYTSTGKPQKLSEIVVKNSKGAILRKFNFSYDYFSGIHLKLNSITEYGQTGLSNPPHIFTYNTDPFPSKTLNKMVDHWGYYNDKPNTSLLPSFLIPTTPAFSFNAGNRQSTTDAEVIKKGVLTSIAYPTGGSSVFEYEMNEYRNVRGEDAYEYVGKSAGVYDFPPTIPNPDKNLETFTITRDSTPVEITFNWVKADENANSLEGLQSTYGNLRKTGVVPPVLDFNVWNCPSYSYPSCTSGDPSPESVTLVLDTGTYTLSVYGLQGYITTANAFWNDRTPISQRKAAGLRIKSIKNYVNNVVVGTRKFDYTQAGSTTGLLIYQPKYNFNTILGLDPSQAGCGAIAQYLSLMSSSVYSYGISPSTIIGYDKVTEIFGENGENGKNEYFYLNSEGALGNFPFTPVSANPLNGKLYRSVTYASNGAMLKKVDYLYDVKESVSLSGIKIHQPAFANQIPNVAVNFSFYSNLSNWVVLSKETEIEYNNTLPITKVKNNYFENSTHKQLTREELISSSSVSKNTYYKYPQDISPATSVSLKLIADGKTGTILEQSQTKGTATNKSNNQFSLNWAPLSLLESVTSTNTIGGAIETRLRYQAYDNKANVLSASQEFGAKLLSLGLRGTISNSQSRKCRLHYDIICAWGQYCSECIQR